MLVYGGVNIDFKSTSEVYIYTPLSNTWRILNLKGHPPIERHSHSISSVKGGDMCIVFGGIHQNTIDDSQALNDVHILDLENLHWISLIVGGAVPPPVSSFAHSTYQIINESSGLVHDEILIVGGVD